MRANEIITERYFNAFKTEDKQKYAQEIWDMIQRSYKAVDGIHGKGFNSVEDMVNSNYMFKVGMSNGKPVMVSIYKDKGGRKKVAMGTDGSEEGLRLARNSLKAEFTTGRAFGEISGPVFGSVKKMIPPEVLKTFLIPATKVADLLGKRVEPGRGEDMRSGPNDPYLPYYYQREIGGHMHTKVAYGEPKGQKTRWHNTKDHPLDYKT